MSSLPVGSVFSEKRKAKAKASLIVKMDKVPTSAKRIPPKGGSRKGIPNKVTRELKEMILEALDNAGGVAYLAEQAEKNPSAFMTLVGKVLPMQVKAEHSGGTSLEVRFVGS